MKRNAIIFIAAIFIGTLIPKFSSAQKDKDRIVNDSKEAKTILIKADPSMKHYFDNAYGYVILPNVGKGGAIVGGAGGRGAVYEKGKLIGTAEMIQASVGAQIGGQAFREVIFFENKEALDRLINNKIEVSQQVSAVAVKTGASANLSYRDGIVIFTQVKEGLMAEATVSGQKFTYKSI